MTEKLAKLVLILLATMSPLWGAADYRFEGAERVVAMSDPHGAFDAMVATLEHAGVIDGDRNWAGGGFYRPPDRRRPGRALGYRQSRGAP